MISERLSKNPIAESISFDKIIDEMLKSSKWELGKIKDRIAEAKYSDETWSEKISELLEKLKEDVFYVVSIKKSISMYLKKSETSARKSEEEIDQAVVRHFDSDWDKSITSAKKIIAILGELGRIMPDSLRTKVAKEMLKYMDIIFEYLDKQGKDNLELCGKMILALSDFIDVIADKLSREYTIMMQLRLVQLASEYNSVALNDALISLYNLNTLKVIAENKALKFMVVDLIYKLTKQTGKEAVKMREGLVYSVFVRLEPILTHFYNLPEFLSTEEKLKFKILINEIPFQGAAEYDKLVKLMETTAALSPSSLGTRGVFFSDKPEVPLAEVKQSDIPRVQSPR